MMPALTLVAAASASRGVKPSVTIQRISRIVDQPWPTPSIPVSVPTPMRICAACSRRRFSCRIAQRFES